MGHIYRELKEIPLPEGASINHYDGTVCLYSKGANSKRCKKVLGIAASETTMHPNQNFKFLYPELWAEYYGKSSAPISQVHMGLYSLLLGTGTKTGLYPIVLDSFGPQYANAIMDFIAFSIYDKSCTAALFQEKMYDQMLFSRKAPNDSWLSGLFSEKITSDMIHDFRMKWLSHCAETGTDKVWLCIDGSNNDCAVKNSTLAGPRHAKSHNDTNIVSYIWAVNTHDGRPITWFINHGGMPDCKAIMEIISFLEKSKISIDGVILDRGFVSQDVLDLLEKCNINYILMLKDNTFGHTEMMNKHYNDIIWNTKNIVDVEGVFGITDNIKIFYKSQKDSCVSLYYNAKNSTNHRVSKIKKVITKYLKIKSLLPIKEDELNIESDINKFFCYTKDENETITNIELNYEIFQSDIDKTGFYSIASSKDLSAKIIYNLYKLRSNSEVQYSIIKSQLGFDVTRVHSDSAIETKLAICFIASLIRTEIEIACKSLDFDTNNMILKMDCAYALYTHDDKYIAIRNLSNDVKHLLSKFGVQEEHFTKFAEELNEQNTNPILSQVRVLPSLDPKPRNRGGRPRIHPLPDPNAPKRGPGRPKGSRNKSTLEREALLANHPELAEDKKKGTPGRPKGSKNKATLEREAREKAEHEASKRGPGRPKGSKNKKTLEREAKEAELAHLAKSKGRGRPKGSKNKPKPLPGSSEEKETTQVASPEQIDSVAPPMPQISVDTGEQDAGSTAPVQEKYSAMGDGKSEVS